MAAIAEAPVTVAVDPRGRITFSPAGGRPGVVLSEAEIAVAIGLSGATWSSRSTRPAPEHLARQVMAVLLRHSSLEVQRLTEADRATNLAELPGETGATTGQLRAQRTLWGSDRRAQQCTDAAFLLVNAGRGRRLRAELTAA